MIIKTLVYLIRKSHNSIFCSEKCLRWLLVYPSLILQIFNKMSRLCILSVRKSTKHCRKDKLIPKKAIYSLMGEVRQLFYFILKMNDLYSICRGEDRKLRDAFSTSQISLKNSTACPDLNHKREGYFSEGRECVHLSSLTQ